MVVALLGVLKAGAAYLPLDPDYPAERLAFMLATPAPRAAHARPLLGPAAGRRCADAASVLDAAGIRTPVSRPRTDRSLDPDNPAYVIYTSGSTGDPKGVVVTHGGLAQSSRVDAGRVPA